MQEKFIDLMNEGEEVFISNPRAFKQGRDGLLTLQVGYNTVACKRNDCSRARLILYALHELKNSS